MSPARQNNIKNTIASSLCFGNGADDGEIMKQTTLEKVSLWLAEDRDSPAPFAELLERADIFKKTRDAQKAVLTPSDFGAISYDLRANLAARICAANNNPYLASFYSQKIAATNERSISQPDYFPVNSTEKLIVEFMDKVANNTQSVIPDDITQLQRAGIDDADIVRLCELNAFLAYQLRVAAGLASIADAGEAA